MTNLLTNDQVWFEDKNDSGFTAVIWDTGYPKFPWKVNLSKTKSGLHIRSKHFATFEAARDYCLKVTHNQAV